MPTKIILGGLGLVSRAYNGEVLESMIFLEFWILSKIELGKV